MSLLTTGVLMIIWLFFFPSVAAAHLVTTGLGPFYDGAMHLFLSPGDLLGLVAALLLAGLHGDRAARNTVVVLPVAWFAAGLIGLNMATVVNLPWLNVLFLVILGVLVAVNPKLPTNVVTLLAGLYGGFHGVMNGSALAANGTGWTAVLGVAAAAFIITLLCSAWVVSLQAAWSRIVVRVAGSWVAAVGMLMLGWLARG